jgi:hypothetical protein
MTTPPPPPPLLCEAWQARATYAFSVSARALARVVTGATYMHVVINGPEKK